MAGDRCNHGRPCARPCSGRQVEAIGIGVEQAHSSGAAIESRGQPGGIVVETVRIEAPHLGLELLGERLIPAWAGNTSRAPCSGSPPPVHPRVGGEHRQLRPNILSLAGSSPRGRGTHECNDSGWCAGRFIPAWAGNTRVSAAPLTPYPVHPRVGGEHTLRAPVRRSRRAVHPRVGGEHESVFAVL